MEKPDKSTEPHLDPDNVEEFRENIILLANDINNQLSGIIGSAELLKQDHLEPFEKSRLICEIVGCAKQTTHLTQKIIGLHPKQPEPVVEEKYTADYGLNTVLVIDDEEVVRNVAKSILRRSGYEVLTASNGREGIELYKEHATKILCVLLDLSMPYLPGNLVFAKLKAVNESAQVFLMSGLNIKQAMAQFESQEVAGFLQKPFMMEELLEKVSSAKGEVEIH